MGIDYSHAHAAILLEQLPTQSRIAAHIDPNSAWTDETHFLSLIEYDLRVLIWQKTKDAQKNRNQPKPNKTPADFAKALKRASNFDKSLVDKLLKGGENGN